MKKNKIKTVETAVMRVNQDDYLYLKDLAKDTGKTEKECFSEALELLKAQRRDSSVKVETIQTIIDAFSSQTTKAINELGGVIVENITEHSIMNNTVVEEFLLKNLDFAAQKNYFIEKLKADRKHMLRMWNLPNREDNEETLINTNWNPSAEMVVENAVKQNKNAQNSIDDWKTWYIYIQKQLGALILYNYKIVPYIKQNHGNDFCFQYFTKERMNEIIKQIKEAENQLTEAHVIMKEIDNFVVEAERKAEAERIAEENRKAEAAAEAEKARIEADRKAEEEQKKAIAQRLLEEIKLIALTKDGVDIEYFTKECENEIINRLIKVDNRRTECQEIVKEITDAGATRKKKEAQKAHAAANAEKAVEIQYSIVENIVKKGKAKELYRENKDVVLEEYNRIKED